ncbi:Facilitated trehalose transporter Tret1 [Frankliniella fusca]|uniref:Facilitated trehalose transporter Tret1 n=1 Tax=Frankliniella fusca TaxID=407009 RepID=A0AAE1H4W6_9NEOP|nr:Facilitated trehalose transporter Tret1 [Frankliniella fusca]
MRFVVKSWNWIVIRKLFEGRAFTHWKVPLSGASPHAGFRIAASMAALAGGTTFAWTSPALPLLMQPGSPVPLTEDEGSWVSAVLPLGAAFGAPPASYLAQRSGRKAAVLSLAAPFLVSWALVLGTRSALGLYVARLLAGVAVGGVCVACPVYVAEVAEDEVRGACGALLQVMFAGGMLFAYAVGAAGDYVLLASACAAVPVLFLALFAWMPETPAALLDAGGEEEAARSLRWLRRWPPGSSGAHRTALEVELDKLRRAQALAKAEGPGAGEPLADRMLRPAALRALIIALGLLAGQQLSGVFVVISYAESIFRSAGSSMSPSAAAASVGLVMLVMSYATTLVVDRVGRRVLLITSATFMGLSMATLAAFLQLQAHPALVDTQPFAWLPVVAIITLVVAYSLGFGPLPWVVLAEVLPNDVRGPAGSVASAVCWTLSFTVTKSFQSLVDRFGVDSAFWVFAGCCCVTVVFVVFLVPETRGKSLQQIQIELTRRGTAIHVI